MGRLTRRRAGRAAVVLTVATLWLGSATPAAALLGWIQTASPDNAQVGQATSFTVRVSNDNLLALLGIDDIGCVRVTVGPNFGVQSVAIVTAPPGRTWLTSHGGGVVTVHSEDGGGRLDVGQSVTFRITAVPQVAGNHIWTTRVIRDQDCGGTAIAGTATHEVDVAAAPTPTPAEPPTPTPTPTPAPTLAPTPRPTVVPLPSVPLPSLPPLPTVRPTPRPTPIPAQAGSDQSRPDPAPTPTAAERATPEPSTSSTPAPEPERPTSPPVSGGGGSGPTAGGGAPTSPGDPRIAVDEALIDVALGGVDILAGVDVWAVPAATIGGVGLLLLVWVVLQMVGALALVPAVRRLRGEEKRRR